MWITLDHHVSGVGTKFWRCQGVGNDPSGEGRDCDRVDMKWQEMTGGVLSMYFVVIAEKYNDIYIYVI